MEINHTSADVNRTTHINTAPRDMSTHNIDSVSSMIARGEDVSKTIEFLVFCDSDYIFRKTLPGYYSEEMHANC